MFKLKLVVMAWSSPLRKPGSLGSLTLCGTGSSSLGSAYCHTPGRIYFPDLPVGHNLQVGVTIIFLFFSYSCYNLMYWATQHFSQLGMLTESWRNLLLRGNFCNVNHSRKLKEMWFTIIREKLHVFYLVLVQFLQPKAVEAHKKYLL